MYSTPFRFSPHDLLCLSVDSIYTDSGDSPPLSVVPYASISRSHHANNPIPRALCLAVHRSVIRSQCSDQYAIIAFKMYVSSMYAVPTLYSSLMYLVCAPSVIMLCYELSPYQQSP